MAKPKKHAAPRAPRKQDPRVPAIFFAFALAASALAWIGLTGGELRSAIIGAPAVLIAGAVARAAQGWRYLPRARAAPGFALWLLREIFVSAWTVSRMLVARDLAIAPAVVPYPLRLEGEGARAAFMNAVTLTPGTLSAGLSGDRLAVHALDPGPAVAVSLADLEARVARLYGERLPERRA